MEKQELALLVSSLKKGDKDAAAPIYDAYYNDIYLFILRIVKDPHLASDLTQDTFVEILETIEKLRNPSAFLPWSKMIAYHRCTAYYKKKKDLLADEKHEEYFLLDSRTEERIEFIPDASIDQDELKHTIWDMLDSLPEEQRAAILMRYYDEISIKDIATVQQVSEGTIKSRLNYARKSLKDSIIEYEKRTNVKLHCRGVVPLLLWFFREDRLDKGISLTELTPFAETIGKFAKKATRTLFNKMIAAVFASLLVTGGITGVANLDNKTPVSTPGISTESESNQAQINSETDSIVETDKNSEPENNIENTENSEVNNEIIVENTTSSELPKPTTPPVSSETPKQEPEVSLGPDASEIPSSELPNLTLSHDGTYYIVGDMQKATNSHYTIPATYNGLPVTQIADNAFRDNLNLTSISLPNSIKQIGNAAFQGTLLKEITIPNSVTSIGESAISHAHHLTSITLSTNLTRIPDRLFTDCPNLSSIYIPKKVNFISPTAFYACLSLSSIIVEKGNTTYHSSGNCIIETATKTVIAGCNSSQIPSDGSVNQIGRYAFMGIENSTFTIPEGIISIRQQAFDYCENLKSIYLPASLITMDVAIFSNNKQLSDIYYAGTKEQWNTNFPNYIYILPNNRTCTVHCSNGDIINEGEAPW